MLAPKKQKHRKWQKGRKRNQGVATRYLSLAFGSFGLKAVGYAWVSSRQIESARKVLSKYTKKNGRLWIRIFPDKPITKKGAEVPMGGGKGAVDSYVAIVKPGMIMFEMEGITLAEAQEAMNHAGYKLPVQTKLITKN